MESPHKSKKTAATVAGLTVSSAVHAKAEPAESATAFLQQIKSSDENVASAAWQNAHDFGASVVKPLASLLTDSNFEIARNAKRALYDIVRYAGRPGAEKDAHAVETELVACLKDPSAVIRRQALWLLSEVGGNSAVKPMANLLSDTEAREDARCALLRIPGQEPLRALRAALKSAPEDFRFALADGLRSRGEAVEGYPSRKKLPTKQTSVTGPGA